MKLGMKQCFEQKNLSFKQAAMNLDILYPGVIMFCELFFILLFRLQLTIILAYVLTKTLRFLGNKTWCQDCLVA